MTEPSDIPAQPADELGELAEFLRSTGQPVVLNLNDREIWVPGVRNELLRLPLESERAPSRQEIREVLSRKGIWLLSYLVPADERQANCFDYLCADADYAVEKLSAYGRRDTRRGLRRFEIRRCSWEELAASGFQAYRDTEGRHEHSEPQPEELERFVADSRGCKQIEAWAAWRDGEMAAWIRTIRADDWVFITTACSRNEDLRDCPNNALVCEATRHYLAQEGRKRVSYGISSIQHTSNVTSLHKFKQRMGFEAVPMRRVFVARAILRPVLSTRAASFGWDLAARLRPASGTLSKVAGLSRMLSGRNPDPLAWARERKQDGQPQPED